MAADLAILEQPVREQTRRPIIGPRAVLLAAAVCVAAGLLWRLIRYLAQFPIWGDEAFVLVNLLNLDYAGLTGQLYFSQVAPLLFLWAEETSLNLLGSSELAVRLVPFLAGLGGLGLFGATCRRLPLPYMGTLALGLLAVSYYPLRHACEVKPYALDLLMSAGFLLGAWGWLRDRQRLGWLIFLVLWTPFALASSYPAAFVAGAVGLTLLPHMRTASWGVRGLYGLFNVLTLGTFLAHYLIVGRNQLDPAGAHAYHAFMLEYWNGAFPPPEPWHWPLWLLRIHTGNLVAYPIGGAEPASAASGLLMLLGAGHLWRRGQRSLLALCVLPFAMTLMAAALHKYPYGYSARVSQHLAPMICLLMAAGVCSLLARLQSHRQPAWVCAVCLALAGFAAVGAARDLTRPYKTEQDRGAREFAEAVWARVGPGDTLMVCNCPDDTLITLHWHLRCEGRPVHWMLLPDAAEADATHLWLLHFDKEPVPPARALERLGTRAAGWRVASCTSHVIPGENRNYPDIHGTVVELVR